MRLLSPIAFGINESFLPAKYRTVPLAKFRDNNPYGESVGLLVSAALQCCPIDFSKVIYDALKSIQAIASKISYDAKVAAGKVEAKGDHLLCLDDLADVTLIVFLLSEPCALATAVNNLGPYVQGLQMLSELEFAFTNIAAVVRHIMELDFDKFMEEANARSATVLETDPLNIM